MANQTANPDGLRILMMLEDPSGDDDFGDYSQYSGDQSSSFRRRTVGDFRRESARPQRSFHRADEANQTYPLTSSARKKADFFGGQEEAFGEGGYYGQNRRPAYDSSYVQEESSEYNPFRTDLLEDSASGTSRVNINIKPGTETTINIGHDFSIYPSVDDMTPPSFKLGADLMSTPVQKRPPTPSTGNTTYDTADITFGSGPCGTLGPPAWGPESSFGSSYHTAPSNMSASFDPSRCGGTPNLSLNASLPPRRPSPARTPPPNISSYSSSPAAMSSRSRRASPGRTPAANMSSYSSGGSPAVQKMMQQLDATSQNESLLMQEQLRNYLSPKSSQCPSECH